MRLGSRAGIYDLTSLDSHWVEEKEQVLVDRPTTMGTGYECMFELLVPKFLPGVMHLLIHKAVFLINDIVGLIDGYLFQPTTR